MNNNSAPNKWMIFLIATLLVVFYFWCSLTVLDLVTKGEGRLVVRGKNQSIQVSESGVISDIFVEEGGTVFQNDLLAIVNPTAAEGSLDETVTQLDFHRASIARIDAVLNDETVANLKENLKQYSQEVRAGQLDVFESLIDDKKFQQKKFESQISRLLIEAEIISLDIDTANLLNNSLQDESVEIFNLVKLGVIGKSEKFRFERDLAGSRSKVSTFKAKLIQNNQAINQVKLDEMSYIQGLKGKLLTERLDSISKIEVLTVKLPALNERVELKEIRSPINGIVNRVLYKSRNAFVRAGDIIFELVPNNKALEIEAYIDPKDIGKVEVGQNVRVSLTAYDASKYGFLSGVLTNVSADAVYREEKNTYMFMVHVKILDNLLDSDGVPVNLNAGMIAQIDIIRGSQTLLEYFWQPVAKIKDDAFRQ